MEIAFHYVGTVALVDSAKPGVALFRCEKCYALVDKYSRRMHVGWHARYG